jgi:hypothetical protein
MKNVLWRLATAAIYAMAASTAAAEENVILNPGTLSGSVSISGRSITSVTVRAIDTDKVYSGTTSASVAAGAGSIDYVLTLEGGHDYYVMAEAIVSGTTRIYAILPLAGPVHVDVGGDTPLDMSMVPATISGTISTGSNANTIDEYAIYAILTMPEFDRPPYYDHAYAGNLNAPGGTGVDYTLLLAPGAKCNVQAYIYIDGLTYYFYDSNVTAPAAGGVLDRDYPIDVTAASITGYALLQGIDVTYAYVRGVASSPDRENVYSIPDVSRGLFVLGVDEGSWRLRAEFGFRLPAPFDDLDGYLATAYSDPVNVKAGQHLIDMVNFNIDPGFIPGTLNLWGPSTKIDTAWIEATASCGYTESQVVPATGAFLLVCPPDDWNMNYYQYLYFDYPDDPDATLYSSVYQYYAGDPQTRTVQAGQTVAPVDLTFGTIMVRRYFYVAGGGTLSSPSIRAIRKTSPYSEAYGYGSSDEKTEGQAAVTLLMPGTYTVEAFAHVNGSDVEFSPIDVTVEEGDTIVIGGASSPVIKLTNPTNGETITGGKVTVQGTVTDDRGVASITINGQAIAFDSTQNPVAFSHEISINPGQNTITIVATDVDQTGPVTLTISVIGAATSQYSLTITSDDGGSVTIPGEGVFTYNSATTIPIEAAPADARYHFVRWTGTAVDAGKVVDPNSAGTAVTVDGGYTLKANFVAQRVTLTTSSTKGGFVSTPGEGSFEYDAGTAVLIQAEPDDTNHYFTHWSGTGVDADKVGNQSAASTTITMDSDYDLQAHFAAYRCSLSLLSTPGGYANVILTQDNVSTGWLGDVTCVFDSGAELTCMAFASPGYRFTHWTGTIWSTADRIVFPITEDTELTANFVPLETGAGQQ